MRRTTALLLAATSVLGYGPALASGVSVPMDEVRMVSFDKPAATVYVGNPTIADVTIIDSKHAFLLGRSFGTTNLIALAQDGTEITDMHVTVFGKSGGTVTVQRGVNSLTYACAASQCKPTPVPGDGTASFEAVNTQIERHQELSTKAASPQ
jgi:hypothetical protein